MDKERALWRVQGQARGVDSTTLRRVTSTSYVCDGQTNTQTENECGEINRWLMNECAVSLRMVRPRGWQVAADLGTYVFVWYFFAGTR